VTLMGCNVALEKTLHEMLALSLGGCVIELLMRQEENEEEMDEKMETEFFHLNTVVLAS